MTKNPMLNRVLSLLLYLTLVCVVAFFVVRQHSPSLSIGDKAPLDEKLILLNGQVLRLNTMVSKPLVVNFWATWCPPCQQELPVFSNLAKKYAGRVNFVGPVVDSPKVEVEKLRQAFQISYPMGVMSEESRAKWRAESLPTTYIISPSKEIAWVKTGAVSQKMLEEGIEMVLNEKVLLRRQARP